METCEVGIPTVDPIAKVSFVYLEKYQPGDKNNPLFYLQTRQLLRSGCLRLAYRKKRKTYAESLADSLVASCDIVFDAIVSLPSRYPGLSGTYKRAIMQKFPSASDISNRFTKILPVRSGPGATLSDLVESIGYCKASNGTHYSHVLIVDDVLSSGNSAAALITHMREHPEFNNSTLHLVCPLWVQPIDKSDITVSA